MLHDEDDVPLLRTSSSLDLGPTQKTIEQGVWHQFHAFLDGPRPRRPPIVHIYWPEFQRRLCMPATERPRLAMLCWTVFYLLWFLVAGTLIYVSSFSAASTSSTSRDPPLFLSCASTFWRLKNGCGLDGRNCEPFEGTSIDFRCPANCAGVSVLNDRAVGNQVAIHVPFVIGGALDASNAQTETDTETKTEAETETESGIYRADSMICAAAIHAGIVDDVVGGCGRVNLRGPQPSFNASLRNGIKSIQFDSEFPKSYSFTRAGKFAGCTDLRWTITGTNVVFSAIHSLLQSSTLYYYWILFIATFFHVALVSDPPSTTGAELLSLAFRGLLPSLFVGYVFWITAARWTLDKAAPLDRTFFWLGGLWFGALLNYISDKIPISRLLLDDIVRDGGIYWFIGVFALIVAIMVGQMNLMRKAGDLIYYLKIYLSGLFILIALSCIPGLKFRLHHYVFGLLLVPGTAYPTRLSMLYQGILIGLFLDGIARWGFDSILETAAHLREDGALFSDLPEISIVSNWLASGFLEWGGNLPLYHRYSVLVNDVERYRGTDTTLDPRSLDLLLKDHVPYYMRVAFAYGDQALDYTDAATFYANGTMCYDPPIRIDSD